MPRRTKRPTYVRTRNKRGFRKKKKKKSVPWSAIRKHNRRRKRSSLEETVQVWLKEDGISFRSEFTIGRCHVDLLLDDGSDKPRTVVELQGCYWHGCRVCHKELTKEQELVQKKDGRRFAFLRNRGYNVIEIWECQVEREPNTARAILKALAGK